MKPKPDPYGYTLEDKQFLTSIMLYMLCEYSGGAPKDVVLDDIDAHIERLMEYNDPRAQLSMEMKHYDY